MRMTLEELVALVGARLAPSNPALTVKGVTESVTGCGPMGWRPW